MSDCTLKLGKVQVNTRRFWVVKVESTMRLTGPASAANAHVYVSEVACVVSAGMLVF